MTNEISHTQKNNMGAGAQSNAGLVVTHMV